MPRGLISLVLEAASNVLLDVSSLAGLLEVTRDEFLSFFDAEVAGVARVVFGVEDFGSEIYSS